MGNAGLRPGLIRSLSGGLKNRLIPDYLYRSLMGGLRQIKKDRMANFALVFLAVTIFVGIFGPWLTPYPFGETLYADGEVLRNQPPSLAHPLGTNTIGQDILSRIIMGTRPTIVVGFAGGFLIALFGTVIGVTAGYRGGRTESVLMRLTDLAYGVPLIPTAIVVLAILGQGFYISILVIGLILWRSSARILRSQVLQIKERPFILAAKATGSSDSRIVLRHILPNIISMVFLFFATGVGYSILLQAGLTFIGVTSPFTPSWAVMLRNAYNSGYMGQAWWWTLPPGFMISLTTLSVFLLGRAVEGEEDVMIEG